MTVLRYPNLGYDPCPGDLAGYQALAAGTARSAAALRDAAAVLGGAGSSGWRGESADAFRAHVAVDVVPLARQAAGSVGQAAAALSGWSRQLEGLQGEAAALDRQAAPHQAELAALRRSAGLPALSEPLPVPVAAGAVIPPGTVLTAGQQARLTASVSALSAIGARAADLHGRYLDAFAATAGHLQEAGNMAPRPPGEFAQLWHDAEASWDGIAKDLSGFVHDKALWEFLSGMFNVIATVAGILALFPPLTLVFGEIAFASAGFATISDMVLAAFDGGSWETVATDAASLACDGAWMKGADKLAEAFRAGGREEELGKTLTVAGFLDKVPGATKVPGIGAVIKDAEKTKDVAPGMFRLIAASLKEARGDSSALNGLAGVALKEGDKMAAWRAVDIFCGQTSYALSFSSIEQVPGTVKTWVNDGLVGKWPWEQSVNAAAG